MKDAAKSPDRDFVRILVVEDDRTTRRYLTDNLAADGFEPVEAGGVREATVLLERRLVDIALVDLVLPDGDGLGLLDLVRGAPLDGEGPPPTLPIVVLSGRCSEIDRIRALRRGADDVMGKPFSYSELLARIAAVLRRCGRSPGASIRVGPLQLDPLGRRARLAGRDVHLTGREFTLLHVLATEAGRVVTRDELMRRVWGYRTPIRTRTLDTHASRVRAKLAEHGPALVENVWGVGYRLTAPEA